MIEESNLMIIKLIKLNGYERGINSGLSTLYPPKKNVKGRKDRITGRGLLCPASS